MTILERDFLSIFRDAVVIDVDFTDWNNKIVLGVIASSASMVQAGMQRAFLVEFHQPTKFECAFNHHATMQADQVEFVWRIDKFELIKKNDFWEATFRYFPDFPEMRITCKEITIGEIETRLIKRHFPEWKGHGGSLCSITLAKAFSTKWPGKQK